ncbi:hypothetical protein K438DRAFT_1766553 [Mycena galopus ATCC 62051]|nr:hypothetical protein K438DRAFT_1766553 [Mycena galopus ATCC 62051]
MSTSPQLVSREIVNEYHRFRILVVGKAGVGKSSLIHYAFGVTTVSPQSKRSPLVASVVIEIQTISAESRGVCKIDDELISEQNRLFVLHDSMGFEPGQEENLAEAKQFLERRSDLRVPIHDRVHAIWLCVQTPHAVPLIVVFTQFDKLFNKYLLAPNTAPNGNLSDPKFRARCLKSAEAELEKNWLGPGKGPSQSDKAAVANVITITRDLLQKREDISVWVMSAMAQRVSADAKIKASIEVGMRRYWSGLAAGAKFMGMKLDKCIDILHSEIIATWNFLDDDHLLENPDHAKSVADLPFTAPSGENLDKVSKLVGISAAITAAAAGPVAPIAVPAIAGVGLSVLFAAYLTRAYQNAPETLRCLMAYIVDLTLIMEELFHIALAFRPIRTLAMEDIELAMDNYVKSHAEKIHSEIRVYTKASRVSKIMRPQKAEDEVKSLIEKNRRSAHEARSGVSQPPQDDMRDIGGRKE